ncbi:type II toxin-antitoxin system VapC family toxin [Xanthobacter autotrophicus]|uniref:type II toxin-antitoxin system VapC family toxin n=1 Tax=Xanthobacter autotrophicus TaxID=280 RepID=UPI003727C257
MSKAVVVDASVAVKWLVKEEDVESALRLLEGADDIRAPQIVFGEVANALWKKARKGDITSGTALDAIGFLPGFIGNVFATGDLMTEALRMACAFDHPVYDCLYVEGARRLDLPLVTADLRLVRKFSASPYASSILPLDHWRP